jgi:hypothetical protein
VTSFLKKFVVALFIVLGTWTFLGVFLAPVMVTMSDSFVPVFVMLVAWFLTVLLGMMLIEVDL